MAGDQMAKIDVQAGGGGLDAWGAARIIKADAKVGQSAFGVLVAHSETTLELKVHIRIGPHGSSAIQSQGGEVLQSRDAVVCASRDIGLAQFDG